MLLHNRVGLALFSALLDEHCWEAILAEPANSAGIASPRCTGARREAHSTGLTCRDPHFEKYEYHSSPRNEYRIAHYTKQLYENFNMYATSIKSEFRKLHNKVWMERASSILHFVLVLFYDFYFGFVLACWIERCPDLNSGQNSLGFVGACGQAVVEERVTLYR